MSTVKSKDYSFKSPIIFTTCGVLAKGLRGYDVDLFKKVIYASHLYYYGVSDTIANVT
ncbi:MAG: hypothetical protein AAFP93_01980 [Bacteroidota bacterium]